jgi:ribosome-associated protein
VTDAAAPRPDDLETPHETETDDALPVPGGTARRPGLPPRDGPAGDPAPGTDDRAALAMARTIVDLAADKKAADIVLIGVGRLTTLADYFVICSGGSERQLAAIADGIADGLAKEGTKPIGREGGAGAHWVLMDFGAVIVHIFATPEREFYQLEKLWADAPTLLRIQ